MNDDRIAHRLAQALRDILEQVSENSGARIVDVIDPDQFEVLAPVTENEIRCRARYGGLVREVVISVRVL